MNILKKGDVVEMEVISVTLAWVFGIALGVFCSMLYTIRKNKRQGDQDDSGN